MMTNSSGAVLWSQRQKAFGEMVVDGSSTIVNNLRFPGQYFDQETSAHYNYFRDYDPSSGRYVQSDPIGLAAGTNLFVYGAGNPIGRQDQLGLYCVIVGRIPVGVRFGQEDRRVGDWTRWRLRDVRKEDPESPVFWTAYWCNCERGREVDRRFYFQLEYRILHLCVDRCGQRLTESPDPGPRRYYRSQSFDYEQRTLAGGLTMNPGAIEFNCEAKCDQLNNQPN
jgi:RHS repeat-associated protein